MAVRTVTRRSTDGLAGVRGRLGRPARPERARPDHARVVRFLKDNQVDRVIFVQSGSRCCNPIDKMGLLMVQAPVMDAKDAVIQAAALQEG
jgi:predicted Fe-Mo cluster-binding NifX family protein